MRLVRVLRLLALTVIPTQSCLGSGGLTTPNFPDTLTRVLFVGNSLTYVNDLPAVFRAVAQQAGFTDVAVATVAFPDYALEDHWGEGTARRFLREAKWEFVVMQQGPSSLPENQVNLATWAGRFATPIRDAGAQPVLYMVWPAAQRASDFPAVLTSYRNAAAAVSGLFAPAGDAWTAAWEEDPNAALYGPDGFHPSATGTYLAALVLAARIFDFDPEVLPDVAPGLNFAAETVQRLQHAAHTALGRSPARP